MWHLPSPTSPHAAEVARRLHPVWAPPHRAVSLLNFAPRIFATTARCAPPSAPEQQQKKDRFSVADDKKRLKEAKARGSVQELLDLAAASPSNVHYLLAAAKLRDQARDRAGAVELYQRAVAAARCFAADPM